MKNVKKNMEEALDCLNICTESRQNYTKGRTGGSCERVDFGE